MDDFPKFNLIDAGSVGGFTPPWCAEYVDTILKVDPQEDSDPSEKEIVYKACLSDFDGEAKIYVYNKRDCTSMSLPVDRFKNRDKFKIDKVVTVDCYTLDTILSKHDVEFDFLKSDTQGQELKILQGSVDHLSNFCGLHLEIFTSQTYRKAPDMDKIRSFLNDFDFKLEGRVGKSKRFGDFLFVSTRDEHKSKVEAVLEIYRDLLEQGK